MKEDLTAEQLGSCQRKEKKIYKVRNGDPQRKNKERQKQRDKVLNGQEVILYSMCMKTNSAPV